MAGKREGGRQHGNGRMRRDWSCPVCAAAAGRQEQACRPGGPPGRETTAHAAAATTAATAAATTATATATAHQRSHAPPPFGAPLAIRFRPFDVLFSSPRFSPRAASGGLRTPEGTLAPCAPPGRGQTSLEHFLPVSPPMRRDARWRSPFCPPAPVDSRLLSLGFKQRRAPVRCTGALLWRRGWDSPRRPRAACLPDCAAPGHRSPGRGDAALRPPLFRPSNPFLLNSKAGRPCVARASCFGGEGGIRTHVPLPAN